MCYNYIKCLAKFYGHKTIGASLKNRRELVMKKRILTVAVIMGVLLFLVGAVITVLTVNLHSAAPATARVIKDSNLRLLQQKILGDSSGMEYVHFEEGDGLVYALRVNRDKDFFYTVHDQVSGNEYRFLDSNLDGTISDGMVVVNDSSVEGYKRVQCRVAAGKVVFGDCTDDFVRKLDAGFRKNIYAHYGVLDENQPAAKGSTRTSL